MWRGIQTDGGSGFWQRCASLALPLEREHQTEQTRAFARLYRGNVGVFR